MKTLFSLLILSLSLTVTQATTIISTDGTDAANLQSINIDGTVYSGSNLIGVDVTAFNMVISGTQTFQIVPEGAGASQGVAATGLLEDTSLTTGFAGLDSDTFSFLSPIENRDGADAFIFEYSPTESATLNVTINGNTINIGSSPFTATGTTVDADLYRNTTTASTTIAILESITSWSHNQTQNGSSIGYHAIDFSDYGVADGASISELTLAGNNDWDITSVVGLAVVPEPSSVVLLLVGVCGFLLHNRSRRKG